MTTTPALEIVLPYSYFRVWCVGTWEHHAVVVNLSKNSQLRTGDHHQALIRVAKRQMAADVTALMAAQSWPAMACPLRLDARITRRTRARADDDGAWVGLYAARDAIALALGIDDSDIVTGAITWATGEPEATEIRVSEEKR